MRGGGSEVTESCPIASEGLLGQSPVVPAAVPNEGGWDLLTGEMNSPGFPQQRAWGQSHRGVSRKGKSGMAGLCQKHSATSAHWSPRNLVVGGLWPGPQEDLRQMPWSLSRSMPAASADSEKPCPREILPKLLQPSASQTYLTIKLFFFF